MYGKLIKAMLYPLPLRAVAFRWMFKRFKLASYRERLQWEAVDRPWYGYCVYHAADLARSLGINRISVAELGVAGGNGLVCLEEHAEETERVLGIKIDVYGFDAESGLPAATDYTGICLTRGPQGRFQWTGRNCWLASGALN